MEIFTTELKNNHHFSPLQYKHLLSASVWSFPQVHEARKMENQVALVFHLCLGTNIEKWFSIEKKKPGFKFPGLTFLCAQGPKPWSWTPHSGFISPDVWFWKVALCWNSEAMCDSTLTCLNGYMCLHLEHKSLPKKKYINERKHLKELWLSIRQLG